MNQQERDKTLSEWDQNGSKSYEYSSIFNGIQYATQIIAVVVGV